MTEASDSQAEGIRDSTLEDRDIREIVKGLRREVRILKWVGGGCLVFALAITTAPLFINLSDLPFLGHLYGGLRKKVEANEFGMYSRQGPRVLIADDDKFGYPNLIFLDTHKNYRMAVKVWPEGDGTPGLVFYDSSGIRGNLRLEADGNSVLNLLGQGGKGGIALSVKPDGTPSLKMTGKDGELILELPGAKP
jgi:hypothetical protein